MKNEKAKQISDVINSTSFYPKRVGVELSTDHRYLQEQFFECSLAFIACLANNYRNGRYDARNEFACKCAYVMMSELEKNEDLYWKEHEDKQYQQILSELW